MKQFFLKTLLLVFAFSFFANPIYANSECNDALEDVPILAGGRVKPLRIHAKEMIRFLTGKSSYNNQSAITLYCEMSLSSFYSNSPKEFIKIRVDHKETKEFLGVPIDTKFVSPDILFNKLQKLKVYVSGLESRNDTSAGANDLKKVLQRILVYENIMAGENWVLPYPGHIPNSNHAVHGNITWLPLKQVFEVLKNKTGSKSDVIFRIAKASKNYSETVSDDYLLELTYDKLHLFQWAMLAILFSLVLLKLLNTFKNFFFILSLCLVFGLEIAAVTMRILISGRAPVTNMYETVMWVGMGALFISTILSFVKKEKLFLYLGLFFNLICLFMMTFANNMLDPSIQPLVPVLRDNFWLSTHVTMITISYAALGLSWFVANFYLIRSLIKPSSPKFTQKMGQLCYDAIKVGVVLLAGGIILGGVWADYSWGRFWGWDPKETWSLIALMFYMAILHGRFSGWINKHNFLPFCAFAFLTVIMAWFGVNYILASGLHSYGFSNGGAIFITSVVVLQIAILVSYYLFKRQPKTV